MIYVVMAIIIAALLAIIFFILSEIKNKEEKAMKAASEYAEKEAQYRASKLLDEWKGAELVKLTAEMKAKLESDKAIWLFEKEAAIRRDAINRSEAVLHGRFSENFVPFMEQFELNPRDTRFVGNPVDLIVFEGASDEREVTIWFIEVKTGKSGLSYKERLIREAVIAKRVTWKEIRV